MEALGFLLIMSRIRVHKLSFLTHAYAGGGGEGRLLNKQNKDCAREKLNTFVVDYRIEDVSCWRIGNVTRIKNRR
jgi:hypothetical protein